MKKAVMMPPNRSITKYYHKFATIAGDKNKVPIVLAKLGNDAGIYGSAKMVLK